MSNQRSKSSNDIYVHAYSRTDGTRIPAHHRSHPDGNPNNNWSTIGNINPYTGEKGHNNPNK